MTIIRWFGVFLVGLAIVLPRSARAQGVDVTVMVNYESIPTTNKELLRDFGNDVKTYLSNFNWGPGSPQEKIRCTINVFIQSVIGDNRYAGQVFIGSVRPIYKSEQSTAVTRIFDGVWEFTYSHARPLNHNPHTFDDLTSFLDFYMYLILGYDYDTSEKMSGTPLFQKASDIASLGRTTGGNGWQLTTTNYSRLQLITELLNPQFEPARGAFWTYHFAGLDSLAFDKAVAFKNLISAIQTIGQVKKHVDPSNLVIKLFFDAKAKEIADVFMDYPDPSIYDLFSSIDPNHQNAYDEARAKRH